MRGWKPRRPSPRIRRRLFGGAEDQPQLPLRTQWAWAAPVLAAGLLALWRLSGQAPGLGAGPGTALTGLVASVALDRPQWVAYLDPWRHSTWNAWSGAAFEWTNDTVSQTTAPPPFLRTNGLIQ
jgi:hypothetical protein